jgi:hypothetical protein
MVQRIKTGMIADDAVTAQKLDDSTSQLFGFRNRIINGDMRIDQRNAGASVTPTASTYTLDRWRLSVTDASKLSVQQSADAPAGFTNSTVLTSLSSFSVGTSGNFRYRQFIEGFNVSDFQYGTASATPVTLSFWVKSSLTGNFGLTFRADTTTFTTFPVLYTINTANTWEYKTITIPANTIAAFNNTQNGRTVDVLFSLGAGTSIQLTPNGSWQTSDAEGVSGATSVVGTNGATFYITGVQLEIGSVATPFERRPFGMELVLCQRYYQQIDYGNHNGGIAANWYQFYIAFPVVMRTDPTMTTSARGSNTGNAITLQDSGNVNGWTLDISNTTSATIRGPNESVSRGHFGRGKFSAEL